MKTAAFYTLGCKVNQYETQSIRENFLKAGYKELDFNLRLMAGIKQRGLALSESEADDLTRYFEKLIAQGVDVSYKN